MLYQGGGDVLSGHAGAQRHPIHVHDHRDGPGRQRDPADGEGEAGIRLLAPAPGASLSAPPTLSWTAIPKASYYNVQLFKGTKILSAWPTKASLKLKRTWRFGGQRHRLARGRYRWYVWPGFGSRKAAHYGHGVGTATFVIR